MNAIDKRIGELSAYNPDLTAPDDLQRFWDDVLREAALKPLNARRERVETPISPAADVYDVRFEGFDDTPVAGWFLLPRSGRKETWPCLVLYHGYHGGRGLPEAYAPWLMAGFAVFAVDIRGQGGDTGNRLAQESGMTGGWITQNILHPRSSYYMAVTVDSLRAVDWAAGQPEIDPARIGVAGGSQGGGVAMLVSALSPTPSFTIANIPNMCHMDYGILHSTGSLREAAEYVGKFPDRLEPVLRTLSYFDNMNSAHKIRGPILVSVGLKDPICPPETVFAAYNKIQSDKKICIYPFNGHSTGERNIREMLEFARHHTR